LIILALLQYFISKAVFFTTNIRVMKKVLLSVCLLTIFYPAYSQVRLGFKMNTIADGNWETPMYDLRFRSRLNGIRTDFPVAFGLHGQYEFGNLVPSVGVQVLRRNIKFHEFQSMHYGELQHHTLEIPIDLNYYVRVQPGIRFIISAGICMDRVLTTTGDMTQYWNLGYTSNGVEYFHFEELQIVNQDAIIWSSNFGVGMENEIGKLGTLQIRLQYHYQLQKTNLYVHSNTFSNSNSNYFRANYGMLSLTWLFPKLKKSQTPEFGA
jgi:hypothetical protein